MILPTTFMVPVKNANGFEQSIFKVVHKPSTNLAAASLWLDTTVRIKIITFCIKNL